VWCLPIKYGTTLPYFWGKLPQINKLSMLSIIVNPPLINRRHAGVEACPAALPCPAASFDSYADAYARGVCEAVRCYTPQQQRLGKITHAPDLHRRVQESNAAPPSRQTRRHHEAIACAYAADFMAMAFEEHITTEGAFQSISAPAPAPRIQTLELMTVDDVEKLYIVQL
jgi:hypothetical protein